MILIHLNMNSLYTGVKYIYNKSNAYNLNICTNILYSSVKLIIFSCRWQGRVGGTTSPNSRNSLTQ